MAEHCPRCSEVVRPVVTDSYTIDGTKQLVCPVCGHDFDDS